MPDWKIDWTHWLSEIWTWVESVLLVPDTLVQLAIALVALLAVRLLITPLRAWLNRKLRGLPPPIRGVGRALANAAAPILLSLLLWFATLASHMVQLRSDVLRLTESLVLVWVLIRLSSRLIRNELLARAVAVTAWIVAALNIAGLIDPVINLLGAMVIPIGNFHLSLLLILKGLVTFSVLLWLANIFSRLSEQRLRKFTPLSPAMQVLTQKLIRMLLLTLAVIIALGSIGIDLTAFAVFSGAIGVGIGFGLQKVVSNLVSGVILLLDRSIKPGDVIAIDETYGVVHTLGARYVSVRTRDSKEYLIPNEDLVTHRVTNWTYSSNLIRLHVKFSTSDQADPHELIRLAPEALRDVTRVLADPEPACLLMGFGNNQLDFELRFWIKDAANGMANVRGAVILNLWDLLCAHGIELPSSEYAIELCNPDALAQAFVAMQQKTLFAHDRSC